jgi:Xaa-Arg dipeptidase
MPINDDARQAATAAIAAADSEIRNISRTIHANPELAFEEHEAHALLTNYLEGKGFDVTRGAHGLETAFTAVAGSGSPTIAVLCEYDALPGIGHACGHNLIAASGIATGLGIEAALGEGNGTVVVMGTPAEEGGGGKVKMIEAGAFDDIDAAMMLHPTGGTSGFVGGAGARWLPIAIQSLIVEYHGKNAHAGVAPWEGVNALDAMVMAYSSIGLLRQQLPVSARVHGIITEGGQAPNIIPDHTAARFYVRDTTLADVERLKVRVLACFQAAADATGCTLDVTWDAYPYSDLLVSSPLADAYERHGEDAGLTMMKQTMAGGGSTDMGNVSYVVPSIHPMFGIEADDANHTPGFTAGAGAVGAEDVMLQAARALCMTALDLYEDSSKLAAAKEELRSRLGEIAGATGQ